MPEEDYEIGDATVQFEKGKIVGEAFAAGYFRADVAKKGLGIVVFIKAADPAFGRIVSDQLQKSEWHRSGSAERECASAA